MKLTTEDIQFIDNYLDNSDVIYADIRMEMVDHVASDIENRIEAGDTRDFYYVFKDYMVENKAQLLNDNKQFLKSADKKIGKTLLKELIKPLSILIFLVSFIGFYFLHQYFKIETFKLYVSLVPLFGLIGFLLTYAVYHNLKQFPRFSVVERLAFPFFALYQLTSFTFNVTKYAGDSLTILWFIGGVSLVLTLMLVMFKVSIKLFKNYDKRFKTII